MIVCPNCDHHNPEGATQCEACYTPLPEMVPCINCGAPVQVDANFCGQCGFNLQSPEAALPTAMEAPLSVSHGSLDSAEAELSLPPLPGANPGFAGMEEMASAYGDGAEVGMASSATPEGLAPAIPAAAGGATAPDGAQAQSYLGEGDSMAELALDEELDQDFEADLEAALEASAESAANLPVPVVSSAPTQLQNQRGKLLHIRSNVTIELPDALTVVHIGKANDRVPPDIDVSGFPDSEIVSRVHADILVEGDAYYIEDLGSSNGTFVNNLPLAPGNRHRLRVGDRISLGKGDLVTFLFQVA